jgi:hypothetical protein
MNAHLGHAITDRLTISEMAERRIVQSAQDPSLATLVQEACEPFIKDR